MDPLAVSSVSDHFAALPDPRSGPALRHDSSTNALIRRYRALRDGTSTRPTD